MKFKLSKYLHVTNDEKLLPNSSLLFLTRQSIVIEISKSHLVKLQNGDFNMLPFSMVKKLLEYEALVPEEENELNTILCSNKASEKDNTALSFTIQPTANCQLGCHYCGQVHSKKLMNLNTADLMIDRIKNKIDECKGQSKSLNITWYGGEPLTGLSSIEYSSFKLQEIAKNHSIKYSANIVTNGLALKEKLFQHLVIDHKIREYQITLDGTSEYHDKRRMLKNGSPSFKIIFNNICNIVKSDFYTEGKAIILIRCNVNEQNRDNVFELMDLLKKHEIHKKVVFSVSRVMDWGDNEASSEKEGGISKQDFAQLEIDVMLKQISEGFLSTHTLIPERVTNVCMATSQKAEVFDGFGNISTCWEVPYTPFYEGSEFIVGNLNKDIHLDSTNTSMRKWYDEIPTNESWCKSCKFLPVCGGSCPKEWYAGRPACPSFKFNIDERLLMKKFKIDN